MQHSLSAVSYTHLQAVPLMITEAPVVGTGIEVKTAVDSGVCVVAKKPGTITYVSSKMIRMTYDDGEKAEFHLYKFTRSNQSNCYNQKPIVFKGDHVEAGQVIADGPSTCGGELGLGKNLSLIHIYSKWNENCICQCDAD